MKKYLVSLCLLAASAVALASGSSIVGNGGFRNPKEGVATFAMNIHEDALYKASFIFASEGSHHGPDYPDVVFRSMLVTSYQNVGNVVMIMGEGRLYNEIPVNYMARFVDAGPVRADYFELHCWTNRAGHIVHFAQYLTVGDLVVTPGK